MPASAYLASRYKHYYRQYAPHGQVDNGTAGASNRFFFSYNVSVYWNLAFLILKMNLLLPVNTPHSYISLSPAAALLQICGISDRFHLLFITYFSQRGARLSWH